jgi:hypothetical protein
LTTASVAGWLSVVVSSVLLSDTALAVPVSRELSTRRTPPPTSSLTMVAPTPVLVLAALILSRRSASVLAPSARVTVNDLPPVVSVTSPLPSTALLLA